jgi:hypothetical protein
MRAARFSCPLTGANLTDTYLAGVSSGGITGMPAKLPSDWLCSVTGRWLALSGFRDGGPV